MIPMNSTESSREGTLGRGTSREWRDSMALPAEAAASPPMSPQPCRRHWKTSRLDRGRNICGRSLSQGPRGSHQLISVPRLMISPRPIQGVSPIIILPPRLGARPTISPIRSKVHLHKDDTKMPRHRNYHLEISPSSCKQIAYSGFKSTHPNPSLKNEEEEGGGGGHKTLILAIEMTDKALAGFDDREGILLGKNLRILAVVKGHPTELPLHHLHNLSLRAWVVVKGDGGQRQSVVIEASLCRGHEFNWCKSRI
ncbi:thioredoxin-like/ATP-binding protein [Actinidia rufa]|uniref:Thioredoxin-like/ATP-binding protein n=1 Tax=Actinidia rufa TaxID=165716 RepID=A0A7J0FY36_9ERIC|nr:thioredoxin-like/ATP-binding protein [Actinidia rufa]